MTKRRNNQVTVIGWECNAFNKWQQLTVKGVTPFVPKIASLFVGRTNLKAFHNIGVVMKKNFDIGENGTSIFELHGHQYGYTECKVLSERMSFNFQVINSVLRTMDGKFVHIMVMTDGPEYSQNRITRGSYIAEQVNEETAKDLATIDNAFS